MLKCITKALAIIAAVLMASCTGIFSTLINHGPGPEPHPRLPVNKSLFIPLNFSIRANKNYDLRQQIGNLTTERIQKFISIGVRTLSDEFGFDAERWIVDLKQDNTPPPKFIQTLSPPLVPRFSTPLSPYIIKADRDYQLIVTLQSPISTKLQLPKLTQSQAALIDVDKEKSADFKYRVKFSSEISASLVTDINDTIFIDINLNLIVERKSSFADDKYFEPIKSDNQINLQLLKKIISETLLQAYYESLNNYGFNVEKGHS